MTSTTALPEIPFSSFKSASEFTAWFKSNYSDDLAEHLQDLYGEEHPHRWLICANNDEVAFWPLTEELLKKAEAMSTEDPEDYDLAYGEFYDAYRAWILEIFVYHTGLQDPSIIDDLEFFSDDDGNQRIGEVTIVAGTPDFTTVWVTRTDVWDTDGITFAMIQDAHE